MVENAPNGWKADMNCEPFPSVITRICDNWTQTPTFEPKPLDVGYSAILIMGGQSANDPFRTFKIQTND